MATWYVDSAAAGTAAGTSWTNACTSFAQLLALGTPPAAGDDINVSSAHSESTAAAITLTFPGSATSPNRILSCDKTNAPAQASDLLSGAVVATTGTSAITVGGCFYMYGVTLKSGSTGAANINMGGGSVNNLQIYDTCQFWLNTTSGTTSIFIGSSASDVCQEYVWINSTVRFGAVGQAINPSTCKWTWRDTASAISASGSVPTNLFKDAGASRTCMAKIEGVDLSQMGANALNASRPTSGYMQVLNCKLGSGAVSVAQTQYGVVIDLINSDNGATGYRQERWMYQGNLTTSTAVYNNASDTVTPISWKIITASVNKLYAPFECFDIVQWVAAGTYASTVVNVTSATASLTNADIWVDAHSLDTSGVPISTIHTSGVATVLTAGTTLTSGSAWVTPLGGSPNNYVLSVPSFTTAIAGFVRFSVKIAKTSLTVYIDPYVTVA